MKTFILLSFIICISNVYATWTNYHTVTHTINEPSSCLNKLKIETCVTDYLDLCKTEFKYRFFDNECSCSLNDVCLPWNRTIVPIIQGCVLSTNILGNFLSTILGYNAVGCSISQTSQCHSSNYEFNLTATNVTYGDIPVSCGSNSIYTTGQCCGPKKHTQVKKCLCDDDCNTNNQCVAYKCSTCGMCVYQNITTSSCLPTTGVPLPPTTGTTAPQTTGTTGVPPPPPTTGVEGTTGVSAPPPTTGTTSPQTTGTTGVPTPPPTTGVEGTTGVSLPPSPPPTTGVEGTTSLPPVGISTTGSTTTGFVLPPVEQLSETSGFVELPPVVTGDTTTGNGCYYECICPTGENNDYQNQNSNTQSPGTNETNSASKSVINSVFILMFIGFIV